jgi:predicted dehydrogenase
VRQDVLRCAIVGCGRISSQHVEGFLRAPHVSIQAFCDVSEARARELAAAHSLRDVAVFADYRAMLAAIRPDIVSVATPDGEHHAVALAALEAGSHVLCEKPLASKPEEANALVRAAEKRGVCNGVRMPYRFAAAYRYVRQRITSGFVGRPLHMRAHLSVGRLSDPGAALEWRMRRESGGLGALSDLGTHLVDLAFFLLPEATGALGAVAGIGRIYYPRRPDPQTGGTAAVTTPDAAACAVSFTSGCLLTLDVSRVAPGEHLVQVDGSEGSLRCDGARVWAYRRENTEHQRPEADFRPVADAEIALSAGSDLFEEFVRSCRAPGARFSPSFSEGARVVRTIARIDESLVHVDSLS